MQTEAALELFSLCVPAALDQKLAAATEALSPPPEAVVAMMRRLAARRETDDDRRAENRFTLLSTAVTIPVTKDFVPRGDAATMTFPNLSEKGACLFHSRSVADEYLALRWRSAISPKCFLKAVMQVTRCTPLGPCYEVAGQFVMHD